MRRINPFLLSLILFIAGVAAGVIWMYLPVSQTTPGTQTSGKALIGGPFSLVDTDGKRVTDRDFHGKLMLVFFGYTHCPDVCPAELQTMAEVVDKLGAEANAVAPVFISVDPARDTPEALASYVKSVSPRITGLTGTLDETASAAKAYRVYFRKAGGGPDDYTVDHSAFVYLMDRDGNYLTHFTFNTTADAIAAVIKKHLSGDRSA
jgi:protein SCO1